MVSSLTGSSPHYIYINTNVKQASWLLTTFLQIPHNNYPLPYTPYAIRTACAHPKYIRPLGSHTPSSHSTHLSASASPHNHRITLSAVCVLSALVSGYPDIISRSPLEAKPDEGRTFVLHHVGLSRDKVKRPRFISHRAQRRPQGVLQPRDVHY